MDDRFRDFAANIGGTTARLIAEQQRLDRIGFGGDMIAQMSRNAMADGWKDAMRPDLSIAALTARELDFSSNAYLTSSDRLIADMERAGLAGFADVDLQARFGGDLAARLTRDAFSSPFNELCIAASARYEQEFARRMWVEDLLPSIDRLAGLSRSILTAPPFDFTTERLLEDIVGQRDVDAIEALGRATSLRRRRGLYRELGADTQLERLPRTAREAALRGEPQQPDDGESHPLIATYLLQYQCGERMLCCALIFQLESFIRDYLARVMGATHGPDWIESVPAGMRTGWKKTFRNNHGERRASPHDLLSSSNFIDLIGLLERELDARRVDVVALTVRLHDVRMVRNAVVHSDAVIAPDYVALRSNVSEILTALHMSEANDEAAPIGAERVN